MTVAIFDLDNTLIGGDSDYLWGEFLCDEGIITDRESFQKMNDYFYHQYEIGELTYFILMIKIITVSYTHLTLPTICSV